MAGFRTFATGEVLTAANVNDFLMKQSVMVFADDAARTTALGAEVTEGMLTFNKDTGQLEVFDGSDFVVAAPAQNLVAVKSAIFTGVQADAATAGGNIAVTDLSITHEVADASNKLIISAFLGVAAGTRARVGLAIHDGTSLIAIGDASANRPRVTSGGTPNDALNDRLNVSPSVTFVHTPGAGSKTYTVRAINGHDATATVFIGRTQADVNNTDPRGACGFVITEVSA